MQAPRDDLIRMAPAVELRAADDNEGRLLSGYAAVFNADTEINSWEGNFVERLSPGAFRKTLRERGDQVKILFNHGMDPQIGDKPLGKPQALREDKTGLYVEVPLSRTSYNDDLIALLNDKAIDGMSFRFSVVKDEWVQPTRKGQLPQRTITEARLFELGPVTFPAYAASTAGVRSRETFAEWIALPEDKREAIRSILSTPSPEAGEATSEGDESQIDTADEPVIDHSARFTQLKARARLLISEGDLKAA